MNESIRILAIGDVVGRAGRQVLTAKLQGLIDLYRIDAVIVNGENAAGGRSISGEIMREMFSQGVNVITTGNHIWDNRDIGAELSQEPALLRPANYPPGLPGRGYGIYHIKGFSVCVINLQGRVSMEPLDCPFRAFDEIYEEVKDESGIIIVDFHAEATSEKRAFGWYTNGRASAVFGTHTHVQTSDEEILDGGTGYITDIGMTGAFDSVIGFKKEDSIKKFLTQTRIRYEVATGNSKLNGIVLDILQNGKTRDIQRIIV